MSDTRGAIAPDPVVTEEPTAASGRPTPHLVVAAAGVTKDYGGGRGIINADLSIRSGTIHGLIGPNGSGKTTLMRLLLGLAAPAAGSINVRGAPAGDPHAMRGVGALIENPQLRPQLTGRTNLCYLAMLAQCTAGDVDRVLRMVRLEDAADRPFASYSLGMKQRLGLAVALLKDPELLILDEPMNGLDPLGMAAVRDLLQGLRDDGATVVLSSHQMSDIEMLCDRVTVLEQGHIVADDTIDGFTVTSGDTTFVLEGTPVERTGDVLAADPRVHQVTAEGGVLRFDVSGDEAPDVLHDVIRAGVRVRRFGPAQEALERAFLGAVDGASRGSDAFDGRNGEETR